MKTLFSLGLIFLGMAAMAQQYDARLLAKYSEERVEELMEKQPSTIEYWTYYLDHSYTIIDGEATGKMLPTDEVVALPDSDNFNILTLDIHMDRKRSQSFRIQGTSQFLVLKSNNQFVKEFSRNRAEAKL